MIENKEEYRKKRSEIMARQGDLSDKTKPCSLAFAMRYLTRKRKQ